MKKPSKTLPKGSKEDTSDKSTRLTDAQMQVVITRVIELMGDNKTTPQICDILSTELNKSREQVKRYIRKATELLQKDFERDANVRRMEMEESLRKDLDDAYAIFRGLAPDDKLKATWYKLILETKDKLSKFTPEVESKDDDQIIKIEYKVVSPNEN